LFFELKTHKRSTVVFFSLSAQEQAAKDALDGKVQELRTELEQQQRDAIAREAASAEEMLALREAVSAAETATHRRKAEQVRARGGSGGERHRRWIVPFFPPALLLSRK
jgi:hypothetical protein